MLLRSRAFTYLLSRKRKGRGAPLRRPSPPQLHSSLYSAPHCLPLPPSSDRAGYPTAGSIFSVTRASSPLSLFALPSLSILAVYACIPNHRRVVARSLPLPLSLPPSRSPDPSASLSSSRFEGPPPAAEETAAAGLSPLRSAGGGGRPVSSVCLCLLTPVPPSFAARRLRSLRSSQRVCHSGGKHRKLAPSPSPSLPLSLLSLLPLFARGGRVKPSTLDKLLLARSFAVYTAQ